MKEWLDQRIYIFCMWGEARAHFKSTFCGATSVHFTVLQSLLKRQGSNSVLLLITVLWQSFLFADMTNTEEQECHIAVGRLMRYQKMGFDRMLVLKVPSHRLWWPNNEVNMCNLIFVNDWYFPVRFDVWSVGNCFRSEHICIWTNADILSDMEGCRCDIWALPNISICHSLHHIKWVEIQGFCCDLLGINTSKFTT